MSENEKSTGKQGKVRFTLFDALIILLVLLCVAGIIFRGTIRNRLGLGLDLSEYVINFEITGVDPSLPDFLAPGDKIYTTGGVEVGRLLGVSEFSTLTADEAGSQTLIVRPATAYMNDIVGNIVLAEYPAGTIIDAKGALIASGVYSSDGYFLLGGKTYLAVGQEITLQTDMVTLKLMVTAITPKV